MIYILEINDGLLYSPEEKFDACISADRIEKVKRYVHFADRMMCRTAYFLLLFAVSQEYGIREMPEFAFAEGGKPYFKNSNIKFNFSHCKAGVICSVSENETGADIECITGYSESDFSNILTAQEKQLLAACDDGQRNYDFTLLWTLKEAYGKYKGTGIVYDLHAENFAVLCGRWYRRKNIMLYSEMCENYVFSVCTSEPCAIIRVRPETLRDFLESLKNNL